MRPAKPGALGEIQGKPGRYLCLSFLLPFFVLLLGVIALRVAPFGGHNFAVLDGAYYLNDLMRFARLLRGEGNFFYSLQNGLGGNLWGDLAWGGLQPVSALALFATLETIPTLFTWIVVINTALCGLTMYLLLAGVSGHKGSHLIFSTSYAMMGFTAVYFHELLFFIGPQTLPLAALGLVKLRRGQSPLLYILSLAVCIFLNFYFGLMLCVASTVILVSRLYADPELAGRRGKLFRTWLVSSVIAGFLAAPMWLPALKAYSGGGRLNQTTLAEFTFTENMPFLQIFSKLFSGANSQNEMVDGLPNIFCGILVVALVVLFFLNRRIGKRKKTAAALVLGFYLLTFYITAFTLAMHGFTHTNWLPFRYSFVFSFWLIMLAAEEFQYLDELTIGETKRAGAILLLAAILIFSTRYEFVTGGSVVLDFALLLLMWLGFYLYKTKPETAPRRVLVLFLLLVTCGNLYANYVLSISVQQDWELDLETYQENIMVSGAMVEAVRTADTDGFYRMEKDHSESDSIGKDPLLYNYYGVSHSAPQERMFIHKGLCRLGINWFDMRHWYSEGIPAATDSLLGLRYLISENNLEEEKGYERRVSLGDTTLFQNPYALPVSILSGGGITDLELTDNVFENLNAVWKAMAGGTEELFIPEENVTFTLRNDTAAQSVTAAELRSSASEADSGGETEEAEEAGEEARSYIEYSFQAARDGAVYLFDTSIPDSAQGLRVRAIKCCGVYRAGDTVTGKFPVQESYATGEMMRGYCANIVFAYADQDVLARYAEELNARDITFNVETDAHLTGAFTAGEGQRILFTIPWDEGWSCYIDGEKAELDKTWDLFLSARVPAGEHTYELRFFPAWLNYGLMLCAAAFAGLIAIMIVWRRRRPAAPAEPSVEETPPEGADLS